MRYKHPITAWRSAVQTLNTELADAERAKGSSANAKYYQEKTFDRYAGAITSYVAWLMVKNKQACDLVAAARTAFVLCLNNIRPLIEERLGNPPFDYSQIRLRDQLCQWIHEAYWQWDGGPPAASPSREECEAFDRPADQLVRDRAIDNFRESLASSRKRANDYLIVKWQLELARPRRKDWLELLRLRYEKTTGERVNPNSFSKKAQRARIAFAPFLRDAVIQDLGCDKKRWVWEAFQKLGFDEFAEENPYLRDYFGDLMTSGSDTVGGKGHSSRRSF